MYTVTVLNSFTGNSRLYHFRDMESVQGYCQAIDPEREEVREVGVYYLYTFTEPDYYYQYVIKKA